MCCGNIQHSLWENILVALQGMLGMSLSISNHLVVSASFELGSELWENKCSLLDLDQSVGRRSM